SNCEKVRGPCGMSYAKGKRNPNCSCSQSQQRRYIRIRLWCDVLVSKYKRRHERHAIDNGHAFQHHWQIDKPAVAYHAGEDTKEEWSHAIIRRGGVNHST